MTQDFNNGDGFVDKVKEYINTRLAQIKLLFAEKTSKVMSVMIAVVISALVFFLFLVLICIAGAIAIGQWLESFWLGFVIVGGVVLIAGLILWVSKDWLIRKPIMNALIKVIFDKEEMKKIRNIQDLEQEKLKLRVKQLELEKKMDHLWKELRNELSSKSLIIQDLSASSFKFKTGNALLNGALNYGAIFLSHRFGAFAGKTVGNAAEQILGRLGQKFNSMISRTNPGKMKN